MRTKGMRSAASLLLALGGAFVSAPVSAEVEKHAAACDSKMCFHWWPKLNAMEGWQHDRNASLANNINVMVPAGASFEAAEVVIYGNAIYKPRVPDDDTLDKFIAGDHESFRREHADLLIKPAAPLTTADGTKIRSFLFDPKSSGQWERVSYLDEGEYYIVFTVSARSESGRQAAMRAYESLVHAYEPGPGPKKP